MLIGNKCNFNIYNRFNILLIDFVRLCYQYSFEGVGKTNSVVIRNDFHF